MKHKTWNIGHGRRGIAKFFVPIIVSMMVFGFLMPVFVMAQVNIQIDTSTANQPVNPGVRGADGGTGFDNPKLDSFQIVPCDGVKVECNFKALVATFNRILKFLLYMSIPLVVGIILYTGFQFLTAGGDAAKLEKAKKMLIPVAIGIFWVLASWLVVNTILKTFLSDKTKIELQKNSEFQKLVN